MRDVRIHPDTRRPADLECLLDQAAARLSARLLVVGGHDRAWESAAVAEARRDGVALLTLRFWSDEAEIGPLWSARAADSADSAVGCPVCQVGAHLRARGIEKAPARLYVTPGTETALQEAARRLLEVVLCEPLAAGQTLVASRHGLARHRVLARTGCPCAISEPDLDREPELNPEAELKRADVAADPAGPLLDADLRQPQAAELSLERLHDRLVDLRHGPVLALQNISEAPGGLVAAVHSRDEKSAQTSGYGRGRTLGSASRLAILERMERAGSEAALLSAQPVTASWEEMAERALDPRALGELSAEQLAHPSCRVDPFAPDLPVRWVPARVWGTDRFRYVPLEAASYHARAKPLPGRPWGRILYESSNGCALGASLDEAALHGVLEVVERDAFLLTWWAGRPVPRIDWGSVRDTTTHGLRALMRRAGYEVDLYVVTQDVALPVVWALAVNASSHDRYSFTATAAHPDPVSAVRASVSELAFIVLNGTTVRDRARALALRANPWNVTVLDEHVLWYSVPEAAEALEPFRSGPLVPLQEAFGAECRMPPRTRPLAEVRSDVRARLRAAGLDEVLVVDQTGREHRAAGLHAARALVPGAIPMTFGYAHQRVFGLPRLRSLVGPPADGLAERLTVHPFP
ncbi:YcaO-like family protein [Streptomyces sp. NPDC054834]